MASPSHSETTRMDNYNVSPLEDNHQPAKHKENWLELGLGFSIACRKQDEEEDEKGEDQEHQPHHNISISDTASSSQLQIKALQKPPGCSSSSTSSAGLELGLSLGLDLTDARPGLELVQHDNDFEQGVMKLIDMVLPAAAAGNDDHQILGQNRNDDHDIGDGNHDDMAWWPCDMNAGLNNEYWPQTPVPNNPHDYLTRTTRPHSHPGLWFSLQSCTDGNKVTLPQIPKAYIKVKNENVTIFMVKKYLVRKLALSNEAEVEISCMGQKLLHTMTLKQVRDCVWLPGLLESLSFHNFSYNQITCVNYHLMSLHYGRPYAFN